MEIRKMQEAAEELVFVGMTHRLGIFDKLNSRPSTAEEFSKDMNFDYRCTWTLLEALVEMSYLDRKGDRYHVPADVIPRLVDSSSDMYEGDFLQFLLYLLNPWRSLPHVLRTGEPDVNSYAELSLHDFIRGMNSPWKKSLAPEIAEKTLLRVPGAKVVADIGGAPGTMARAFAVRGLRTIVFDLPDCIDVMADELKTVPGIEIVKGDATIQLPEGPWDIAFLGNICHGQSPEDNEKIIKGCYERLNKGGVIVVFDNLRNEGYNVARIALHMITQSVKGDIYTREQYLSWIKSAGFTGEEVIPLSDKAWHLVIAKK